jgi:DNA-binding IclR family transcriptional regulator
MDESKPGAATAEQRYLVPALMRGLQALQAFSPEQPALSLSDLARAIGISRSAAYRIVVTLTHLGFLAVDEPTRRYRLGPAVLRLGFGYLAGRDLVAIATPHLESLRDATGWSAHLAVREGREVVYLARVPTRRELAAQVAVGSRAPAHATAIGRVLLADLPEAELHRLYADATLEGFSPHTATSLPALLAQLRRDRAHGHVAYVGGFRAGIATVAAPVRDDSGRTVAAVNLAAVALLTDEAELRGRYRDAVLATAAAISRELGFAAAARDGAA